MTWASSTGGGFYPDAALALDFVNGQYRDRAGVYRRDVADAAGYSYARSGTKGRLNSASSMQTAGANVPLIISGQGFYSESSITNLLLNSDALSTQGVSVTAQAYTLSFYGTGTVTLSGASTGSLVGTGAANRATLTFTPAAGTLTLTVTGTVQYAMLQTGAVATSYVPSAGSAATAGADALSFTGLTLPGSYTLVVRARPQVGSSSLRHLFNVSDGTLNNRLNIYYDPGVQCASLFPVNGGVSPGTLQSGTISPLSAAAGITVVARNNGANTALFANGVTASTTGGLPGSSLTQAGVGHRLDGALQAEGPIEFAVILPSALSDADCLALSARTSF